MHSITLPRPSRLRMLAGLALALLMQGVWLGFLQLSRPAGEAAAPALLALRLLAPASVVNRPPTRPLGRRGAAEPDMPTRTLPVPELNTLPPATTPVAADVMPPAPAVPRSLNLALPAERTASGPQHAEAMRSQVRQDPRSHTERRTLETAVADAAGTLPVTLQAATDGTQSTIVRQGSKCVRVSEARIKTLHPMDGIAQGTPSVAGPCFKD